MSTELKHTPEPWGVSYGAIMDSNCRTIAQHPASDNPWDENTPWFVDRDRICECVNAFAGIADPAEALRKAREALENVSATLDRRNNYLPIGTRLKVREALRLLTPEK